MRAREIVQLARQHGYTYSHTSGSHMIYVKAGSTPLSIPGPDNRMVSPGVARNLVQQITGGKP